MKRMCKRLCPLCRCSVGLVFDLSCRSVLVVVVDGSRGGSGSSALSPVDASVEGEEHVEEEDRVQTLSEGEDEGPAVGSKDGIE